MERQKAFFLVGLLSWHSNYVSGFFKVGFETIDQPEPDKPVNVHIVIDPPSNFFTQRPYQGKKPAQPQKAETYRDSSQNDNIKPTLSIQLPSRLPFNIIDLFEPNGFANFIKNVTSRTLDRANNFFSGSQSKLDDTSDSLLSDRTGMPIQGNQHDVSFRSIPGIQSEAFERIRINRPGYYPQVYEPILETSVDSYTHHRSQQSVVSQQSQDKRKEVNENYADESRINEQVETLNQVLSDKIKSDEGSSSPNDIAALKFPSFPDLSSLGSVMWGGKSAKSYAVCNSCRVAFGLLSLKTRQGAKIEYLLELATFGCSFFRITSPEMCAGLVSSFGPILHYMVTHQPNLTGDRFCSFALQAYGCSLKTSEMHWTIDVSQYYQKEALLSDSLNSFDATRKKKRSILSTYPVLSETTPTVKILHLTDLHIDPNYMIGSNTECENEMCCHAVNGIGLPGRKAGHYGDYSRCDLPFHSFIDALEHISKTHPDIKLVYMTGDLIPHNIWNTSVASNIQGVLNGSEYISKYFPNARVIPVIGNHETHPVNMFAPFGVPSEHSTEWLYQAAAKAWASWIPKRSIHNFLHAGFYDVEIDPYLRVIVVNTNLCYSLNFWQSFEYRDPGGQLRWLVRELKRSEDMGQYVHIVGHIPPQQDCMDIWSKNFYDIIDRFSNIVKAQFYGHTHYDEFRLHYKSTNRSQGSVPTWIGVSLTPYWDVNPGYKIYTVDGARGENSTWSIVDHETWIYNLTQANQNPNQSPEWFRLYKATDAYDLPDMSPESLTQLVERLSKNITYFNIYRRLYYKASDAALNNSEYDCDEECRRGMICDIITHRFSEKAKCQKLKNEHGDSIIASEIFETPGPQSTGSPKVMQGSSDSPINRVLSFGRSLLSIFG